MPRPTRPYRYRKQMGGLLDFHGFREQTETFLNDLDGEISTANAKIGNLSDLTTTDKSSVVAAINEAAQSGGGGSTEEQFQKVYEVELEEDSLSGIVLTSEDIGGEYIDVIVYLSLDGNSAERVLDVAFASSDNSLIASFTCPLPQGAEVMRYMSFSLLSAGGLPQSSVFIQNSDRTIGNGASGFLNNAIDYDYVKPYPSVDIPGVSLVSLSLSSQAEGEAIFPAYTYVAVYARRKVTA